MLLEAARNPRRSLRNLPAPEDLPGDPWSLRTTKQVAELLGIDPAAFTTWRYRGLGPPLEPRYFKGSVQTYRLDRAQNWLAQRQGLNYDADAAWGAAISRLVHEPGNDIRQAVRQWLEWLGPASSAPDRCQWLGGGFQRYLDSLTWLEFLDG
jgi:hypothetical protein